MGARSQFQCRSRWQPSSSFSRFAGVLKAETYLERGAGQGYAMESDLLDVSAERAIETAGSMNRGVLFSGVSGPFSESYVGHQVDGGNDCESVVLQMGVKPLEVPGIRPLFSCMASKVRSKTQPPLARRRSPLRSAACGVPASR